MFFDLDIPAVAVSFATLGINLLNGLFMFYYVKVFLQIYKIKYHWFQIIQTIFILVNIINEPLIGYLQDYGCLGLRNRRRVILISGPLLALVYLYPWFNWYDPNQAPSWVPALHMVTALFTWNLAFPFVNTALRGLFFEISNNEVHRVKIVKYNEIANLAATTALFPVDKISRSLQDYRRFQYSTTIVAIVSSVSFILATIISSDKVMSLKRRHGGGGSWSTVEHFLNEREALLNARNNAKKSAASGKRRNSGFVTALTVVKEVFQSPNFWFAAGANFTLWFRTQMTGSFLVIFTEVLISPKFLPSGSFAIAAFYTLCQMVPRVAIISVTPLAERIGTQAVIMISFVITWLNSAIGLLGATFFGYNFLIFTLLIEYVLLRFQTMFMIIISAFIEEDSEKHNRILPASTLIFTLNSSVVKPTISLAPLLVTALLNAAGFDQYQSKGDIRHTPRSFRRSVLLIACCIPAGCALIGYYLFSHFKIEEKRKKKKYSCSSDYGSF